ncbi:MAG TPA: hypothetical protein VHN99_02230 [Deinococcales bacterium]|nr:hypothetical protein [Deinococcales bacterium]
MPELLVMILTLAGLAVAGVLVCRTVLVWGLGLPHAELFFWALADLAIFAAAWVASRECDRDR